MDWFMDGIRFRPRKPQFTKLGAHRHSALPPAVEHAEKCSIGRVLCGRGRRIAARMFDSARLKRSAAPAPMRRGKRVYLIKIKSHILCRHARCGGCRKQCSAPFVCCATASPSMPASTSPSTMAKRAVAILLHAAAVSADGAAHARHEQISRLWRGS